MKLHATLELKETPSQTAGPYVHIGLTPNFAEIGGVFATDPGSVMLRDGARGERITIEGRILDGSGAPVGDAIVEFWQPDADGAFVTTPLGAADAPAFAGWARIPTNRDGSFRIETVKPGGFSGPGGEPHAPHIALWIVARGVNIGLHTRLYFADEADANTLDPTLGRIPDPARRATLVAASGGDGIYSHTIRLQGESETVFFDV